ncbi:MAG: hypothetical protein ACXVCY_14345 [Pseudobdellovibrionaceae bacterium]
MLMRLLTYLSFVCFGLLGLMSLQATKRPLCIDSKVVERIDRLSAAGSEIIYRCSLNKETPFSSFFNLHIGDISYRVQQIERVLEEIEPFEHKIQITIFEDRPFLFRVQDHQIYLGRELLKTPGHLEKAIAKIWFRERSLFFLAHSDLMEETITDFLIYLRNGNLDLWDLTVGVQADTVYTLENYCRSAWKQSEHYAACKNATNIEPEIEEKIDTTNLRPILTAYWIQAYKELSLKNRFEFVQKLPLLMRSAESFYSPVGNIQTDSNFKENVLLRISAVLQELESRFKNLSAISESSAIVLFLNKFAAELHSAIFQVNFDEPYFDVLYVSKEPLNERSKELQQFFKMAEENRNLKIALRDNDKLWMMPAKLPLPINFFKKIKAARVIVEKCGSYDFKYVMAYSNVTDKLLMVERCDGSHHIQYSQYMTNGAEGFGVQNKDVTFVQFHLPSLLMKKTELDKVSNVFDFIHKRDFHNSSFRSLGWQEVHWSKTANAYQPKAIVDAIEWYRLVNGLNSNKVF